MSIRTVKWSLSFGTALCLCASAEAQTPAQDAVAAAADETQEIIVTAQFRAQRLQDTPIAITAVNAEMIEQRSQTSLSDVVKQAPSVQLMPQSGASWGPAILANIRGLGQADFNPAMEPGVGLYIDDVYYPRLLGANFDLLDVDRVEVLRGPQGTLTGRNSEGGAIKFYSKRPDEQEEGFVQATYGSRNRIGVRAGANFVLTEGLYARIAGTYSSQEGYVANLNYGCANPAAGSPVVQTGSTCVTGKDGEVGNQALRGSLRYAPNDIVDLTVTADYVRDVHRPGAEVLLYANEPNPNTLTADGKPYTSAFICGRYCNYSVYGNPAGSFTAYALPPATPGAFPSLIPYSVYAQLSAIPGNPTGAFAIPGFAPLQATSGDPLSRYEGWGVSGHLKIVLGDRIDLTAITAYRKWSSSFSADIDVSPAAIGYGLNDLRDKFFSQELRLNVDLGDWMQATLGGYYSDERAVYWTLQDLRYAPIPLQFVGSDPINTSSKAAFGTVILRPFAGLTVTGGLRYTEEHKDYTFHRKNVDGTTINPFLGALDGLTSSYDGDRLDYRLSVDYRFSPELMIYATIATGFKGGGVGPRPFVPAQARSFNPETVTTYEAGIKTDLFDRRLRLNLTGFYNDFKDAQLTLLSCPQFGGPGPCALPQNAGDAHMEGVEAELVARPLDGIEIDGSLSYLDFTYRCVNPAVVGLVPGPCSADPAVVSLLANEVGGWKWAAGMQYRGDLGAAGSVVPRIDVTRQNRQPSNVGLVPAAGSPTDLYGRVPGYTLANARLTWQNAGDDLSIALEVTNVFDRYYFIGKFDFTGAGAGIITGQPGRPREWAVTVKKKF